jgi:ketosteroid isomerase-like protein
MCRPNDANARDATPSPQNPMATRTKSEAAMRELIDGFVKAIRAKDIDGIMSVFAPEVISFDLGPPLQHGVARRSRNAGKNFSSHSRVRSTTRFAI